METDREKALRARDELLAQKKELWWKQKHQVWCKMFNTINEELYKQLHKEHLNYILHDSFEEYKNNFAKHTVDTIENKFPAIVNPDKISEYKLCSVGNYWKLRNCMKDILQYIKDEIVLIVVPDSETPVLEMDKNLFQKYHSFEKVLQMGLSKKVYITSPNYNWVLVYMDDCKNIILVQNRDL